MPTPTIRQWQPSMITSAGQGILPLCWEWPVPPQHLCFNFLVLNLYSTSLPVRLSVIMVKICIYFYSRNFEFPQVWIHSSSEVLHCNQCTTWYKTIQIDFIIFVINSTEYGFIYLLFLPQCQSFHFFPGLSFHFGSPKHPIFQASVYLIVSHLQLFLLHH